MFINQGKKAKSVTSQYFSHIETDILPNVEDSEERASIEKQIQDGLELIDNNEWGIAFENLSEEIIEQKITLDRKGIEIVKKIQQICGLTDEWEFQLKGTISKGYIDQSWKLTDAKAIAEESKYTFYKPSSEVLEMLEVGDSVKMIFEFDSNNEDHLLAERMWVKITNIDNGSFTGKLDNWPFYIHDLFLGDKVQFNGIHVIDHSLNIEEPNLVEKYVDRCFVTARILYDKRQVGYLYRESPIDDNEVKYADSGWRITAGDEDDEYMNDPENVHLVSLGAVLNIDDTFIDLLKSPIGSSFERSGDGIFVEVIDD